MEVELELKTVRAEAGRQAPGCELTILMPCLNEAETIATCVRKAAAFLQRNGVNGEVLVADNGSTDGSQSLARAEGARVVDVPVRGYGAALQAGIDHAGGRFVVMGDADDSYDFSALEGFLQQLRAGADLVMGDRFRGGIRPGAMPLLHRYLGNPVLSFLGRLFFRSPVRDFHCGLRGFSRDAIRRLRLETTGMEFASEMVVKASLHGLRITEVPVTLSPDGRSRPPHLRTWRDGWRHLRFLLLFSPRWLFLLPGLLLVALGLAGVISICAGALNLGGITLDIHTLSYAGAGIVIGAQMTLFALLTKLLAMRTGWLPANPRQERLLAHLTLEKCLVIAILLFVAGISVSLYAVALWARVGFGALGPETTMRLVTPSVTLMTLAGEFALGGFFAEVVRYSSRLRTHDRTA